MDTVKFTIGFVLAIILVGALIKGGSTVTSLANGSEGFILNETKQLQAS